jgi:hypothetical protein
VIRELLCSSIIYNIKQKNSQPEVEQLMKSPILFENGKNAIYTPKSQIPDSLISPVDFSFQKCY